MKSDAMQQSIDDNNIPTDVSIRECTTKFVPIDDKNYQQVIDWFKSCLSLSKDLDPSQRDEYELSLIGNVKTALSSFFQRTELSLNTLIGLEREIVSMFDSLPTSGGVRAKEQSDKTKPCCTSPSPCNPPCCEIEEAMGALHKKLMWVAIASLVLLLLLILVLSTLCWLRKCIAYEMKESFACCPSKEDTNEQYDGDRRASSTSAYPVRVWLNPFARTQANSVKKTAKQTTGQDREKGGR